MRNIDRGERVFKNYIDKYNDDGINYPMTLDQIPKFEQQNNKTINVYGYELTTDEETKKEKLDMYPIYLSKNKITNYKECCNLLLIQEGEKSHYVLIKNMSPLVDRGNKNKSYVCPTCMTSYRTEDKLHKHLHNGCPKFGQKVELPSKKDAKEYVQFKNIDRMIKKPFVIYADFESLLLNVERDEKASTQRYQKHEACGYAYKRVSTLEKYDKPLQIFRGDGTENVAEHFINAIVRECDEITRIRTDIRPKNLTEDEKKEYDSYRVPVIFHNLKGYDSHLIIKAFNNKNFSISCIPTTTEKYLSFTISGKIQFIDSMSFIDSSLDNLVKALPEHKFKHFDNHFKTDIN
jgi:hypothetical protein